MKVILLPKIHKRLSNIAGRQFISTCELLNEKVSAFLENQRKSVKMSQSYINDSEYFLEKIKSINPLKVLPATVIGVGFYSSIAHDPDLSTLKETLEKRSVKHIPKENLIRMT